TDVPNMNRRSTPLQYRFLVAMQGALGIGANLNKWSDGDTDLAKRMVALDKRIRTTVQFGNLYRLLSPRLSDTTANEYISKDGREGVLFAFRHSQEYNTPPPALLLEGLDARAVYQLESLDGKPLGNSSGAYLMQRGVNVTLRGDFDSTAVLLHRVE
ncbi:MAG TPA: GH36 C-terminal domain-containing protein, partial [Pirellulales bacterium]